MSRVLRTAVVLALALGAIALPSTATAAPPANDDFAIATVTDPSALPLSDTQTIDEATVESGEPAAPSCYWGNAQTVWYAITPRSDGALRVRMSASYYYAFAAVYEQTGSGLGGLSDLGCATWWYGTSTVIVNAQAGKTYYVQAGSNFTSSGTLTVSVDFAPRAPNDDLANATGVSTVPFSDEVDNSEATLEDGEPQPCGVTGKTVWYAFTLTSTVSVTVDTLDSSTGDYTLASVYQSAGSGFGALSNIGCIGSFNQNAVTLTLEAGTPYYVQVGTTWNGVEFPSGILELHIKRVPPPPFDDIANARVIPSLAFSDSGDSTFATTGPSDPSCFGQGHSVWYVFTPPEDMRIEAALQGGFQSDPSTFTLSAYAGSPGSLNRLACSDDSSIVQGFRKAHVEFNAKGGVPIYFMIGTTGDRPGGGFYFSVQRPLVIKTTFNSLVDVSKTGTATVSGKITCSRPVTGNSLVGLRQVFGRLVANGSMVTDYFECTPAGTPWSAQINSSTGVLFGPGLASASSQWSNQCDSQGCQPGALIGQGYGAADAATVRLRRSS
jgi:hypothetical protein